MTADKMLGICGTVPSALARSQVPGESGEKKDKKYKKKIMGLNCWGLSFCEEAFALADPRS